MLVVRTRSGLYGDTTILVRVPVLFSVRIVVDRHTGTQGLIFVVDSSDAVRMEEARSELHKIINDREMKDALLLVFANKQDIQGRTSSHLEHLPGTQLTNSDMSPEEVINALQLTKLKDKVWYVAPSVATEGTGILEGLVSIPLHLLVNC